MDKKGQVLNDTEKVNDWKRWVDRSRGSDYLPKALWSVLQTDGEKMFHAVLKATKLEKTVDVIKDMGK